MTKSKKSRRQESSASEEESSNTSSSESSNSSSSSNDNDAKKKKRHKKKAAKVQKVKKSKKSSSSSSSSSAESDGSESGESTKREKSAEKRKPAKNRDSNESFVQHKVKEEEKRGRGDGVRHDSGNRSKWDSPTRDRDRHSRAEHHDRHRQEDSRDRRHNEFNSNNRRQDRHRDDGNRGRDYDRGDRNHDQDRGDRDRRRGDDNREHNRNINRDRDSNQQGDDRRRGNGERNRRDNYERDDRRRDDRDTRGERSNNDRRRRSFSRSPRRRFPRKRDGEDESHEWGKRVKEEKDNDPPGDKEKPNFGLSGKLTEDTNKVNGVIIKYAEPLEARKPKRRWRLYPFKGEKALPTLYIHRQSCYLIGRDRKVCDLPVDHPSCSKQHAALQYRLVPFEREDGSMGKRVRPYIIDLESANGTFLNNKPIEPKKYFELIEKDVIKFGFSSREYVLLHENSKEDQLDDDVGPEDLQDVPIKEEPAG